MRVVVDSVEWYPLGFSSAGSKRSGKMTFIVEIIMVFNYTLNKGKRFPPSLWRATAASKV